MLPPSASSGDLAAKKENPEADTAALEAEIDRHVYALYGLTLEEIALVEASATKYGLRLSVHLSAFPQAKFC